MRRIGLLFALAVGVVPALGCARASIGTQVRVDGAWTRTLQFRGQSEDELRTAFALPAGAPWQITRTRRNDARDPMVIYTARREARAGETLRNDLAVRGRDGAANRLQVANEVTVRPAGLGRWEYREVLRRQGPRAKIAAEPDARLLQTIRGVLPPGVAGVEDARYLAHTLRREYWRTVFGPGEPLLGQLVVHPELGERQLRRRLAPAADRILLERFGDRLSPSARASATSRLIAAIRAAYPLEGKEDAGSSSGNPAETVALDVSVRMPGTIVATNGEVDPATREVYWALHSPAVALEEIVLTATCETNPARVGALP